MTHTSYKITKFGMRRDKDSKMISTDIRWGTRTNRDCGDLMGLFLFSPNKVSLCVLVVPAYIQRSWVRFPMLPDSLKRKGPTQPPEGN
jgi:hypothetical protein